MTLSDGHAQVGDAARGPLKVGDVGTVIEIGADGNLLCRYKNAETAGADAPFEVAMAVSLPYSVADFDAAKQTKFKYAMAAAVVAVTLQCPVTGPVCVSAANVTIDEVTKMSEEMSEESSAAHRTVPATASQVVAAALTTLIAIETTGAEVCRLTTHAGISAGHCARPLFVISLFACFHLGAPAIEGLQTPPVPLDAGLDNGSNVTAMRRSQESEDECDTDTGQFHQSTFYKVQAPGGARWWYQREALSLHTYHTATGASSFVAFCRRRRSRTASSWRCCAAALVSVHRRGAAAF